MQATCVQRNAGQATIARLGPGAWEEYKLLRLLALATDPQAFEASYREYRARPDAYWRERLADAADAQGSWLLFARCGEALAGMIGAFTMDEPGIAQISAVFVAPAARGRGVGSALMRAMLQELNMDRSLRRAILYVNVSQTAAVRLYTRFGFRVVEHDRAILGDGSVHDGYRMERALT